MVTQKYYENQIDSVVDEIKKGKVIAFPTDTVYGLGVRYDDEEALMRLKLAKLRPETKPIPMMVSSLNQIEEVAYVNDAARKLILNFMPGALTVVLKKRENIAEYVSNGLSTIAIRMPNDAFVLEIMNRLNKAMLVTSANISGAPSCKDGEDVLKQLDGRIEGIVMGKSKLEISSTIVDVTSNEVKILREGPISKEMIKKVMEER